MGPGRWGLACCGDKLERNAKRPPRRNRAGALLESLHHTSSDCRTQESELCWPIRARTAARHRADRPGTAARFGRATRTMDGRLVGGQRTGPETGSASDIRSSVRHSFVSPSMTGLYRKPLRDRAIESRGNPWSKSLDLTHTEITRFPYGAPAARVLLRHAPSRRVREVRDKALSFHQVAFPQVEHEPWACV